MLRFGFLVLFGCMCSNAYAMVDTVKFGGPTLQYTYVPKLLNVNIGDTIVWTGDQGSDFEFHPLESTSVPPGADTFAYSGKDKTFMYIVKVDGDYKYQCQMHFDKGMVGSFTTKPAGVKDRKPSNLSLNDLIPNPVASKTNINFSLTSATTVSIKLLSIDGKEIAMVANSFYSEGKHSLSYDASKLSAGTYLVVFEADGARQTEQMVVTK